MERSALQDDDGEPAVAELIRHAGAAAAVRSTPFGLMGLRPLPALPAPPVQDDMDSLYP